MSATGLSLQGIQPERSVSMPLADGFRADIEGLRAIAVVLVLLHHAEVPGVSGGFAGVDIFFVISGYLITLGLLKEVGRTGTVSIPRFYARRARRLLPAASLVLVFTATFGALLLSRGVWVDLATDVVSATFYVINWTLAERSVDYLAEDASPSPLRHYWSLSVEEQFYVVWPLVMILGAFLARRATVRPLPVIGGLLGLLLLGSLSYSVVHTASDPAAAYFITTTRVWELAVGAMVAVLTYRLHSLPRAGAQVSAALGLFALVVTALVFSPATPWPGSAALLPVLGTALVIAAGATTAQTVIGRILGIAPLRFLGGISYALYLWHWPLLIFLEELRPDANLATRLAVLALAIGLSWATKVMVEDPVRYHRALANSIPRALSMAVTTMTVSAVAGVAVWAAAPKLASTPEDAKGALALIPAEAEPYGATGGEADRPYPLIEDPAEAISEFGPVFPEPALAPEEVPNAYADNCQADREVTEPPGPGDCVYGKPDGETRVALVGDSKMIQWLPALRQIATTQDWRLEVFNKDACSFSTEGKYEECEEYNSTLVDQLSDNPPDLLLTSAADVEKTDTVAGSMVEHLTTLQDAGSKIVLVADNPYAREGDIEGGDSVYECMENNPEDFVECSFPRNENNGNQVLKQVAEGMSDVEYLNLNDFICPPGGSCPAAIGQIVIYRQGAHLTNSYVRSMTPILHRELIDHGLASETEVPLEVAPEPSD